MRRKKVVRQISEAKIVLSSHQSGRPCNFRTRTALFSGRRGSFARPRHKGIQEILVCRVFSDLPMRARPQSLYIFFGERDPGFTNPARIKLAKSILIEPNKFCCECKSAHLIFDDDMRKKNSIVGHFDQGRGQGYHRGDLIPLRICDDVNALLRTNNGCSNLTRLDVFEVFTTEIFSDILFHFRSPQNPHLVFQMGSNTSAFGKLEAALSLTFGAFPRSSASRALTAAAINFLTSVTRAASPSFSLMMRQLPMPHSPRTDDISFSANRVPASSSITLNRAANSASGMNMAIAPQEARISPGTLVLQHSNTFPLEISVALNVVICSPTVSGLRPIGNPMAISSLTIILRLVSQPISSPPPGHPVGGREAELMASIRPFIRSSGCTDSAKVITPM